MLFEALPNVFKLRYKFCINNQKLCEVGMVGLEGVSADHYSVPAQHPQQQLFSSNLPELLYTTSNIKSGPLTNMISEASFVSAPNSCASIVRAQLSYNSS